MGRGRGGVVTWRGGLVTCARDGIEQLGVWVFHSYWNYWKKMYLSLCSIYLYPGNWFT